MKYLNSRSISHEDRMVLLAKQASRTWARGKKVYGLPPGVALLPFMFSCCCACFSQDHLLPFLVCTTTRRPRRLYPTQALAARSLIMMLPGVRLSTSRDDPYDGDYRPALPYGGWPSSGSRVGCSLPKRPKRPPLRSPERLVRL